MSCCSTTCHPISFDRQVHSFYTMLRYERLARYDAIIASERTFVLREKTHIAREHNNCNVCTAVHVRCQVWNHWNQSVSADGTNNRHPCPWMTEASMLRCLTPSRTQVRPVYPAWLQLSNHPAIHTPIAWEPKTTTCTSVYCVTLYDQYTILR